MTFVLDALTGQPRILAAARAKRLTERLPGCPFCAGNEEATPPELDRVVETSGDWSARAVPNLFPLAERHEVLVSVPRHATSLRELTSGEWGAALTLWARRSLAASRESSPDWYVHLFVNDGKGAGASLEHSHAQLVVVPPTRGSGELYLRCVDQANCLACAFARDIDASLVVADDRDLVLAAAPTPRTNGSLLLVPRRHISALEEVDQIALARMMVTAVRALVDGDFNCWLVQNAAAGAHWYIEFAPRVTTPAGMELGLGVGVSTLAPTEAATMARARLVAEPTLN